ncbi:hypothetical protein EDM53_01870 [Rickettsiales endosymbiont of Peranema trichophorum]|uniref:hypothetical protein n=1 Tax=Rickettsiales endosymbiont of Peranema trichophorum TaxID=2486577 RepID=UPI001023390E|nr:hypothetical protein [Rickettsiales endosymbiont of Peranema trichophorum]RZI47441.1 hypothetical protein EDM53_01870 [Rickettsiales endosymbiont of Peranema trichophorum]
MKWYIKLLLMVLMLLPLSEGMSEESGMVKKKYPPYPDVWGYDFPHAHGGVGTYLALDGEVIMSFKECSCDECCQGKEEQWTGELVYYVRKFFEGTDIKIGDEVARDQFVQANGLKDASEYSGSISNSQITLRNGITIDSYCDSGGKLCQSSELEQCILTKGRKKPGDNYLNRYQKDAEVFTRHLLLQIVSMLFDRSFSSSETSKGSTRCPTPKWTGNPPGPSQTLHGILPPYSILPSKLMQLTHSHHQFRTIAINFNDKLHYSLIHSTMKTH